MWETRRSAPIVAAAAVVVAAAAAVADDDSETQPERRLLLPPSPFPRRQWLDAAAVAAFDVEAVGGDGPSRRVYALVTSWR